MNEQQLQDNINWLLLRVSLFAKQGLMKLSVEYDLTIMQAYTICLLEPNQAVPMHSLSSIFNCDPSNVTGIVERLVTSGYIERQESSVDRRVKTIGLTESGNKLRDELLNKITESNSPNLSKLSKDEIKVLKKLLLKILPVSLA